MLPAALADLSTGGDETFVTDSTTGDPADSLTLTRQQTNAVGSLLPQPPLAIEVPPVVHHVGINPMFPCHTSYRCSRLHRQLYNPALLSYAAPLPLGMLHLRHR